MKHFPCIVCGLCCKNSYLVPELQSLQNEDNICKHFNEHTKKCKIYKSRPLICNIDEMYAQVFCRQMSKKEFYLANLKVCYELNSIANNQGNMKKIQNLIHSVSKMK